MSDINVLITSAGRRAYIIDYFKKTEGVGKVYASNSTFSVALKRADGYFISPLIYEENYIVSIIDFCRRNNITCVLSLFDIDLLVLAKNRKQFEKNGIRLISASPEFIEICNDKYQTFLFLNSLGLRTPQTFISQDMVKSAINNRQLEYPILIKPRWGMASIGIYKVTNDEELYYFSEKCKRDIFESHLKYESQKTAGEAVIYQEFLNGEEYGLDILNDLEGNYLATFAKQKISMRSGETDLGKSSDSLPFVSIAQSISQESKHEGICSVDCIKTREGIFIIEMNCRISGHYPISYLAGFNYPQLVIDWMNGKPTNTDLLKYKIGLYIIKDLVPMILEDKSE